MDVHVTIYGNYLGRKRKMPLNKGIALYRALGEPAELGFLLDEAQYTHDYSLACAELNREILRFIRHGSKISAPWVEAFRSIA